MKKLLILILLFEFMNGSFSQTNTNNSLGNLEKIDKKLKKQTFVFETANGQAQVTIFTPNIFRIRIARKFGPDFSYAVTGELVRGNFDYAEDNGNFMISTDSLILEVQKNPLRFTFKTKDGKVINQDDPSFGTSWIGTEVSTYKVLQKGEKFLGLGEKTGHLDRRGEAYVNWNTDNPRYSEHTDPLYASIPFYIGRHHGLNYGIFLDNSYRTVFNFGASNDRFSFFSADDGEMDYYFIWHENIADIIKTYTWLTGRMELPPIWALGYQQCRWSYTPDSEVLNIARTFREKKIPADVVYLDIDHMDAYKIFTWHPENFPNPEKLLSNLQSMGFHTTIIVDPGIKVEEGYPAYDEGLAYDHFVKYPDGKPWTAQVWPGWCHFPDFTDPDTRQWWGEKFMDYVNLGVDGFWNDMNEIATWGQQPPHLIEFNWEGNKTTYRQAKNMYGMQMSRATFEGVKKLMDNRRPLVITRAGFAGLQRYTSIWTGDNQATDEHMLLGIRLVNSLGLSGVSFAGSDIGGFGGDATPELFARWMQIGAFTPFFRGHTAINTKSAEPWAFGEWAERVSRNYISLRYRLLPYVYTGMLESAETGMPMNRSLAIDYTDDEKVFWRIYENQFLFGPSMLVIPAESDHALVKAYLPEGEWYNFYNDAIYAGKQELAVESPADQLPVFIRGGSMIPMQSVVQHTSEKPSDTLEVHLYKSFKAGDLEWEYYEDDGVSYDYLDGKYFLRKMIYKAGINEVEFTPVEGNYSGKFNYIRLVFHGFDDLGLIVKFDGKPRKIYPLQMNFRLAAEKPPKGDPSTITCPSIIIPNSRERMIVNW